MTYNTQLYRFIIRVSKEDSAFVYFQLEANEGLSFYSTLNHTNGDRHRDLEINATNEFKDEIKRLIEKLSESIEIQILDFSLIA